MLADHATPCPDEFNLPLSLRELEDELLVKEQAVVRAANACRNAIDPWRKTRLADEWADAVDEMASVRAAYEAALRGEDAK